MQDNSKLFGQSHYVGAQIEALRDRAPSKAGSLATSAVPSSFGGAPGSGSPNSGVPPSESVPDSTVLTSFRVAREVRIHRNFGRDCHQFEPRRRAAAAS